MSRSIKVNSEGNKISKDDAGLGSTLQCVPITSRLCEKPHPAKTKSGLKQKLVSKVKSWSSKDTKSLLLTETKGHPTKSDSNIVKVEANGHVMNLTDANLEENMYKSELVRARDSLENLLESRNTNKAIRDPDKFNEGVPHAAFLCGNNSIDNTNKVLWDPWNKLSRKNKKEKIKRPDKTLSNIVENVSKNVPIIKIKNNTAEFTSNIENLDASYNEVPETFEYQPYKSSKKSVNFVNEVLVIYFTGDEVVNKVTEPLKKELDQQVRNKDMRLGHIPCTLTSLTQNCRHEDLFPFIWHK